MVRGSYGRLGQGAGTKDDNIHLVKSHVYLLSWHMYGFPQRVSIWTYSASSKHIKLKQSSTVPRWGRLEWENIDTWVYLSAKKLENNNHGQKPSIWSITHNTYP